MRLIDMDNLIRYANNQRDKTVDANDIARMPRFEAVPIKPLADSLAWYAMPPDPKGLSHADLAEAWEEFLRGKDWMEDDDEGD